MSGTTTLSSIPGAAEDAPEVGSDVVILQDVTKVYTMGQNKVSALAGVDMVFKAGSFSAIMGASGSGKSTMLNSRGCLDRPTTGKYILEGQLINLID